MKSETEMRERLDTNKRAFIMQKKIQEDAETEEAKLMQWALDKLHSEIYILEWVLE